jgi:hypothetical protein
VQEKAAKPAPVVPTAWLALAVTLIVGVSLWVTRQHDLSASFGDTDDALRLVIVRDLISGRAGWFDQHMMRLQPPLGMELHWSRLIDGGLAGLQGLLRLGLPPDRAELAMRALWPTLWIFPAVAALISIARRLGGDAAAPVAAAMLAIDLPLYAQWLPGRIDHHNVQISLALLALAAAMRGGWRGALAAGLAAGLGLAVGLEDLAFQAVVGAGVALQFLFAPQPRGRPAQAYAAGLLAAALPLYLAETPPAHWAHAACDTISANLVAALIVAAVGLIGCVALTARRGPIARLAGLATVGALAAGVYLALDPTCLRGPLAEADPRIGPIWLSHVNELLPLSHALSDIRQVTAWGQAILMGLGAAAWLWLGRRRSARDAAWLMAGAWLAMGIALGVAVRMAHYPAMLATAILAAAAAGLARRHARGSFVAMALIAVLFTPTWVTTIMLRVAAHEAAPNLSARRAVCNTPQAYRRLAALPAGRVLGEIDLGPYVLVTSRHSVMAAPYHRMAWGILAAHDALAAAPGADEAATRRLGVDYVLGCAAHANLFTHATLPANSLQRRLDRGDVPAWLQPLSPAGEAVQVYAVKPRSTAAG